MVENFTNLALVKSEMAMSNMAEANNSDKNDHIRIISMSLSIKRIITKFITIRLVMNIVLFFEVVCMRVRRKDLMRARRKKNVNKVKFN